MNKIISIAVKRKYYIFKNKEKRKINEGSIIWYNYLILINLFNFYKQELRACNNIVFFVRRNPTAPALNFLYFSTSWSQRLLGNLFIAQRKTFLLQHKETNKHKTKMNWIPFIFLLFWEIIIYIIF